MVRPAYISATAILSATVANTTAEEKLVDSDKDQEDYTAAQREWKEAGKAKMDSDPFLIDFRLNETNFVTGLVDSGCLCYSVIS